MVHKTPSGFEKKEEIIEITPDDFIPRTDAYVHKILVIAKRYLSGERKNLVI